MIKKICHFLPGFFIDNYYKNLFKKQKVVDFDKYDLAILECGWTVYLMFGITKSIVYRQSDQYEVAFGSKRTYFKNTENKIYQRAISISSALQAPFLPKEFLNKYSFWHSGFIPPAIFENCKHEKKFVYAGGGVLDYVLVKKIAKKYPDYTFLIVGKHRRPFLPENVTFCGFVPHKEYLQIISSASVFIIPFTSGYGKTLHQQSYSAKIFVPMSIGMPILVKKHGSLQHTEKEKKLYAYDTHEVALMLLDKMIQEIELKTENFNVSESTKEFLFSRRPEQKIKELHTYFEGVFSAI
ncbi:MAG: hypothetical protein Ta2B_14620 [Termitinemataceae bacterium]|nr:MAG: hypothetical protein Ta2B_14620 [Termitinemataceae bacterium]